VSQRSGGPLFLSPFTGLPSLLPSSLAVLVRLDRENAAILDYRGRSILGSWPTKVQMSLIWGIRPVRENVALSAKLHPIPQAEAKNLVLEVGTYERGEPLLQPATARRMAVFAQTANSRRGEDSNPRCQYETGMTAFEAAAFVHSATSPSCDDCSCASVLILY
jgi:hypothetical protein